MYVYWCGICTCVHAYVYIHLKGIMYMIKDHYSQWYRSIDLTVIDYKKKACTYVPVIFTWHVINKIKTFLNYLTGILGIRFAGI